MVSGMTGFTTSSTISLALRVATLGWASEFCFFSARMVAASRFGASRPICRSNSAFLAADRPPSRASQSLRSVAPLAPILRQASTMSLGMSKAPCGQP